MEVASPALVIGGYQLAGSLSLLLARSSLFVSAINYKLHSLAQYFLTMGILRHDGVGQMSSVYTYAIKILSPSMASNMRDFLEQPN